MKSNVVLAWVLFMSLSAVTRTVSASGPLEWGADNGSCTLGEGENAVTVTAGENAVAFAGVRPKLEYLGKYLPEEKTGTWQTVLENASLDDIEVYSTKYYNPSAHPGVAVGQAIDGYAFPSQVEYAEDGSVSMVLMLFDSVYTKGAKITLRQDGDDIVGRVDWAKYAKGDFLGADNDFTDPKWSPMNVANEEVATNSYGIDQLTFVPKNGAMRTRVRVTSLPAAVTSVSVSGGVELVFDEDSLAARGGTLPSAEATDAAVTVEVGKSPVYAPGTFSGTDSDVSFVASPDLQEDEVLRLETNMVFTVDFSDCVFRDVRLADVTNAVAWMSGSNLSPTRGYHVQGFFFENDGKTASCQFQFKGGDFIKCVLLEMEQSGNDVRVKTPYARFINFTKPEFAQYDEIGTFKFTGYNGSGGATVTDGAGYCITNLLLNGNAPSVYAKLSGVCLSASRLRFSFKGGERCRLVAETADSTEVLSRSPAVLVDVRTNASLILNKNSAASSAYRVFSGGAIDNWANWSVNPSQEIRLEGGSVRFGTGGASTYARKIVFRDGAAATGGGLLFGNGYNGTVTVSGTKPSVVETGFGLYCEKPRTFTFFVDDVTGSSAADFTVRGEIYHNFPSYTDSTIVKTGSGTMRWESACTAVGNPIELSGGTLSLGGTAVLQPGHSLVFSGGALAVDAGSENVCSSLSLTADATLELGAGATLAFSSVGKWAEGASIAVTAGKDAGLRIGTSACLTRAQLAAIRINGVRVEQNDDGSVVMLPRPTILLIR